MSIHYGILTIVGPIGLLLDCDSNQYEIGTVTVEIRAIFPKVTTF